MRFCEWLSDMKEKTGISYSALVNATGAGETSIRNHAKGVVLPRDYMMEEYFEIFDIPTNKWDQMRLYFRENEKKYKGGDKLGR